MRIAKKGRERGVYGIWTYVIPTCLPKLPGDIRSLTFNAIKIFHIQSHTQTKTSAQTINTGLAEGGKKQKQSFFQLQELTMISLIRLGSLRYVYMQLYSECPSPWQPSREHICRERMPAQRLNVKGRGCQYCTVLYCSTISLEISFDLIRCKCGCWLITWMKTHTKTSIKLPLLRFLTYFSLFLPQEICIQHICTY